MDTRHSLAAIIQSGHGSIYVRAIVLFCNVFDGLAVGVFNVVFVLVVQDLVEEDRLSSFIGVAQTGIALGGTISGFVGEALAGTIGYTETFLILGFIACGNLCFFVKEFQESHKKVTGTMKSYYSGQVSSISVQ
jgi:predicted MFS family arabinose efflux permease